MCLLLLSLPMADWTFTFGAHHVDSRTKKNGQVVFSFGRRDATNVTAHSDHDDRLAAMMPIKKFVRNFKKSFTDVGDNVTGNHDLKFHSFAENPLTGKDIFSYGTFEIDNLRFSRKKGGRFIMKTTPKISIQDDLEEIQESGSVQLAPKTIQDRTFFDDLYSDFATFSLKLPIASEAGTIEIYS